jgi:hypothetical protein
MTPARHPVAWRRLRRRGAEVDGIEGGYPAGVRAKAQMVHPGFVLGTVASLL